MSILQEILGLNEVIGDNAPMAKLKKIKQAITPEVFNSHYDFFIKVLASKLTLADIDELVSVVSNTNLETEDTDFILELLKKQLESMGCTRVQIREEKPIDRLPKRIFAVIFSGKTVYIETVAICYKKGKWEIDHRRYSTSSVESAVFKTFRVASETEIAPLIKRLQKTAIKNAAKYES